MDNIKDTVTLENSKLTDTLTENQGI